MSSKRTDLKGTVYWFVKVTEDVSFDGEMYLSADTCRIEPNGELVFYGHPNEQVQGDRMVNFALAPGKWHFAYSASCLDGDPVAVEHWKPVATSKPARSTARSKNR
jgi:hypothetical protein